MIYWQKFNIPATVSQVNSLENLQTKQNKSHNKSQAITMYNLKEINEELFQFVTQFDPLIAAVFLLDYKCWGSGTLILDYYHRRIKTIDSRKYYIVMDIFSFILFMCSVFFDILYPKYYKDWPHTGIQARKRQSRQTTSCSQVFKHQSRTTSGPCTSTQSRANLVTITLL